MYLSHSISHPINYLHNDILDILILKMIIRLNSVEIWLNQEYPPIILYVKQCIGDLILVMENRDFKKEKRKHFYVGLMVLTNHLCFITQLLNIKLSQCYKQQITQLYLHKIAQNLFYLHVLHLLFLVSPQLFSLHDVVLFIFSLYVVYFCFHEGRHFPCLKPRVRGSQTPCYHIPMLYV